MGIQGLLPLLKSIQKPTHLRNFAGQTLGVDAYGWLHRGTFACAAELAQQKPTRKHIDFALNRVRMLIHFGVKPYIVFDGDYLPSKAHTEKERASKRKESNRLGLELLRTGRDSQAQMEFQKAIDVTPLMARELIEELKLLGVPYIVAPYEADSQLAYLEKQGIISGILSEDSDLLVFGAKCLLTKLDQYGECIMVKRADFTACRDISLVGWTDEEFRMMAILSGCDYLPGISSLGVKTAYRLIRKHKTIERVIKIVQFDGKKKVPAGYLEDFTKAERAFLYQWVFCPVKQCLLNLTKVPPGLDIDTMPYIGRAVDTAIAAGVAAGELDPNTKEQIIINSRRRGPILQENITQTPDEKHGKSISEFFKPKRIPLAELDPNTFTPSPSQQRLLQEQQAHSWSASQIPPSRLPSLHGTNGDNPPSSVPQPTRGSVRDQLHGGRVRPPPKRQRLCSDSILADSMKGKVGLVATSPFFQPNVIPSPSLRKSFAQRKRDDFDLWSDDSTGKALATMTSSRGSAPNAATPSPKKRKKLQVFTDPQTVPADEMPSISSAENTQSTTMLTTTSGEDSIAACDTSRTSFDSTSQRSIFSNGVNASFAALRSSFTYNATMTKTNSYRTQSAPYSGSTIVAQAPPDNSSSRLSTPPPNTTQQNTTQQNTTQQRSLDTDDFQDEHATGTIVPCSSPLGVEVSTIEDQCAIKEKRQTPSPLRALAVKGSEDLLVPASPCSGDEDNGRSRLKFDLARFAFTG